MKKKAVLGEAIQSPFILIMIFVITIIFLALSFSAAKLRAPDRFATSVPITQNNPLLQPIKAEYILDDGGITVQNLIILETYLEYKKGNIKFPLIDSDLGNLITTAGTCLILVSPPDYDFIIEKTTDDNTLFYNRMSGPDKSRMLAKYHEHKNSNLLSKIQYFNNEERSIEFYFGACP